MAQDVYATSSVSSWPYLAVLPLSSYMRIKYGPARGRWRRVAKWAGAMQMAVAR